MQFNEILSEIDKIKQKKDIIIIKTTRERGYKEIKGFLLEQIVYQTILDDGFDTDDQPTQFLIETLSGDTELIDITGIHKVEVQVE